ncbi:MAG: hypothetical protein AABW54_03485 [Candidatus Micrarchaeota archaeon]
MPICIHPYKSFAVRATALCDAAILGSDCRTGKRVIALPRDWA